MPDAPNVQVEICVWLDNTVIASHSDYYAPDEARELAAKDLTMLAAQLAAPT